MSRVLLLMVLLTAVFTVSASPKLDSIKESLELHMHADAMFAYADIDSSIDRSNFLAGYEPYGFSVQHASLYLTGNTGDKTSFELELGTDSLNLKIRDLYFTFQLASYCAIRAGRMPVPGAFEYFSDSSFLSDSTNIFFDRSHASQRWALASYVPDGRTEGAQMHGYFFKRKLFYAIFVGNPDGIASFRPRQNTASYQHFNNSLTGWGRIEYSPFNGLSAGAFIGDGKGRRLHDSLLVKLITYGGNIRYAKHNVFASYGYTRAKTGNKYYPQYVQGHVLMLAYRWKFLQPVYRYSLSIPDAGRPDMLGIEQYICQTYGLNFHFNYNMFLRLQYVHRQEVTAIDDDLLLNNMVVLSLSGKF